MAFGCQQAQGDMLAGYYVPGGERVVNRLIARTAKQRQANFTIDGIIQCATAMTITGKIQIDQISAASPQFFVCQPTPRWEIADEQACGFTWCGN